MAQNETIVRFEQVSFEYSVNKPILREVDFSIRKGLKLALMGQNGAGKSTIFKLITGEYSQNDGDIHIQHGARIAIGRQVMPRTDLNKTVRELFQGCFKQKVYDIDPRIDTVLDVVNLPQGEDKLYNRVVKTFSGGQQARLLLACALIQDPDILLLDEPTNNLDHVGIEHLTLFLKNYQKTVVVISHDAEFLNSFTDGVLYLDIYTKKIEYYVGNYHSVVRDIKVRVEKENMKNAQLQKEIQAKKDQANKFAMKGGNLRLVAKRMRDLAEELEDDMVDVRKEDKSIRPFIIPVQDDIGGELLSISHFSIMKNHRIVEKKAEISLRKRDHLLLVGPNGIGKSTLLEKIANSAEEDPSQTGSIIKKGVRVGYYRQDFSTLNFEHTVYQSLRESMEKSGIKVDEEKLRSIAAGFLITGDIMKTKIGNLSEGQKGLVAFAALVMERPGLLILDEPTNHINFRHIPIIAKALDQYEGAMVIVSHVEDFVSSIRIDQTLYLDSVS